MTPGKKHVFVDFCRHRKEVSPLPLIDFQKLMLVSREVNACRICFLFCLVVIVVLKQTTNKTSWDFFHPTWSMELEYVPYIYPWILKPFILGKIFERANRSPALILDMLSSQAWLQYSPWGEKGGWNQAVKMWGEETAETASCSPDTS